jgi:hypothetical protein
MPTVVVHAEDSRIGFAFFVRESPLHSLSTNNSSVCILFIFVFVRVGIIFSLTYEYK